MMKKEKIDNKKRDKLKVLFYTSMAIVVGFLFAKLPNKENKIVSYPNTLKGTRGHEKELNMNERYSFMSS